MRTRTFPHTFRAILVTGLVGLGLTACGSSSSTANTGAATSTVAKVTVTKPWARTSPTMANAGAAYFIITSPVDDTITAVSVPPTVAMKAEMHQTVTTGGPATVHGSAPGTAGGGMTMVPVDKIDLKAGVPFVFEPGGYHIMLMQLAAPLKAGTTFQLTLTLAKAGTVTFDVPVQDDAP